ncbi:BQ2448_1941 [Microbotryum intermedium]|uniref:Translation initiation factor eIF2B subunit alpha n=1 Tax=Microbotryum intermedium TaxID=269621 RepID=A0A238F9X1_9BASI|nr:BQ2448_1941 [Microbotryum intermedium]
MMGSPRSARTPSSPTSTSHSTSLAGSHSSLPTLHEASTVAPQPPMDVVAYYSHLLAKDDSLSMPIAAIETLAQLISQSDSSTTTTELFSLLHQASTRLAQASFNPISLTCGTSFPDASFQDFKAELVARAREFVKESGRCRQLISVGMNEFVRDGAVSWASMEMRCGGRSADDSFRNSFDTTQSILIHSYSRVVVQALLHAAQQQKKWFQVYVTESRPFGLGLKTQSILEKAGIPCIVVLDSSVAYIMPKCDLVIVGAEAVCESGGLVNFIGGYQVAVVAKAMGKPLYGKSQQALAESFKFTRLFPLSQYDLPTSLPNPPLTFPDLTIPTTSSTSAPHTRESTSTTRSTSTSTIDPSSPSHQCSTSTQTNPTLASASTSTPTPPTPSRPMIDSAMPQALEMTDEMTRNNPTLDYTTPDLITLIISDLGCLTPSGVSDALLSIFGGT